MAQWALSMHSALLEGWGLVVEIFLVEILLFESFVHRTWFAVLSELHRRTLAVLEVRAPAALVEDKESYHAEREQHVGDGFARALAGPGAAFDAFVIHPLHLPQLDFLLIIRLMTVMVNTITNRISAAAEA